MPATLKTHHRLLLTGAAGGLGTALRERLKANCDVLRLSDKAEVGAAKPGEEVVQADLADAAQVDAMVQGCDAIVHMGGISVEAPFAAILQANIVGAYHLYEAARRHGVRRIVFASSNHVTGFYRQDEVVGLKDPARPDGLYGLSKAFGEDQSRYIVTTSASEVLEGAPLMTDVVSGHVEMGINEWRRHEQMVRIDFIQTFTFINNKRPRAVYLADWILKNNGLKSTQDIPSPVGAAHAYDTVHLLAKAIDIAQTTSPQKIRDALEKLPAFHGAVRHYTKPFTHLRHDALDKSQVLFVKLTPSGQLIPQ